MGELTSLPAQNFEEAASGVLVDYQKVFKEKWTRELRRKYSYSLNKRLIKSLEN
jgi:hypothetical protein